MRPFLRTTLFVTLVCSMLPSAQPAGAVTIAGQVVRVSLTSVWSTKSPDPMGITYNPRTKLLMISDSEVDEIPALWKGKNFFIVRRGGRLVAARSLKKFTVEPEDLAWNNATRTLYVTDDDIDRVSRVSPGKDRKLGTRDDHVVTLLNTHRFGSYDPEGLAYRPRGKMLIVSDSTSRRVYKIQRGKDKRFGTADDVVHSFGTARYGFTTAEDVAVNGKRLFIVSSRQKFILVTNMLGGLIRKIDISGLGIKAPSGITFAPGTDGSRRRLYLTDSGVDNAVNPTENDGKLFELKFIATP